LASDTSYFSALSRYVRAVADAIGLRDYEVEVEHRPTSDNSLGECDVSAYRRSLRLRVCAEFRDLDPQKQRHVIVHELVHAHFSGLDSVIRGVERWMPESAFEMFYESYDREQERGVDAVAVCLCNAAPLPVWD